MAWRDKLPKLAKPKNLKQRMVKTLGKFSVLMLCVLVAWGIVLDAQIERKFDGIKWPLPIQVLGAYKQFAKGDELNPQRLATYLKNLNYRQVSPVQQAGDFSISQHQLTIFRRAYVRPDDKLKQEVDFPEQLIRLTFKQGRLAHIQDLDTGRQLTHLEVESFILDRIQASNLEDREFINISKFPPLLKETLLLVEDRNFYQHYGVSPIAIARALIKNIRAGRTVQGGSTLTQQLVKNMFLTNERSLWRKLKEAYLAILLDAQYSKDEILEAYINEVYLGQNYQYGVHGFGLASRFYFGKGLAELNPAEVATLVAVVKGPSYYNPRRYHQRTLARRDLVLRLMTEHNLLSREQYEHNVTLPLKVMDKSKVATGRYPNYLQQVKRELKGLMKHNPQQFNGLRIYTHFDPLVQTEAQAAIAKQLPVLEKRDSTANLQAAMVVIDSQSGGVSAIVGDRKAYYNGFNRALNAKRNIGSLVKPAIYLTALESKQANYHLASKIADEPITLASSSGKRWQPKNYDGKFIGSVQFVDALVKSRNVPAVNLGMQLGLDSITTTLQTLGVKSHIPQYPSMLLGSVEMSPYEVAQWYQPIANMGYKRKLSTIASIYQHGELLAESQQLSQPVVTAQNAYLLNFALQEVTRSGTAKWLSNMYRKTRYAGKTGTTNDTRDSWFVGYEQNQLAVVWLGRDDNKATGLTGSSGALKVFGEYQRNRKAVSLVMPKPKDIAMRYFDKSTGLHVEQSCDNSRLLPAIQSKLSRAISCDDVLLPEEERNKSWFEKLFGW